MKKQTMGLTIIGVALIVVIIFSLAYQTTIKPHHSCKMAFSNIEGLDGAPFNGGEEADPTDSISWLEQDEKDKQKKEKFSNAGAVKVEGFELHPASVGDYQPIDYFSSLKAGDCAPSGYTKISGNLCLDDKAIKLLKTRGGNMSSGESQIGV